MAFLGLGVAGPAAHAQAALDKAIPASRTIPLQIGGVVLTVPIPEGYCTPRGEDGKLAQWMASLDKENITYLQLDSCGSSASNGDYYLIKGLRTHQFIDVTLTELLDGARANFATATSIDLTQVKEDLGKALSTRAGSAVNVDAKVVPRGLDELCAYMGGTLEFAGGLIESGKGIASVGICLTVIGGRMITINVYAPGGDPKTLPELLAKTKSLAKGISVAGSY
ncbi:MAG: hypothetical protein EOP60_07375 [Sphingomonadales bacterium]|nr:MAG: hypothetical protein EOP60_07375 [Sphingomonadales bacterium]